MQTCEKKLVKICCEKHMEEIHGIVFKKVEQVEAQRDVAREALRILLQAKELKDLDEGGKGSIQYQELKREGWQKARAVFEDAAVPVSPRLIALEDEVTRLKRVVARTARSFPDAIRKLETVSRVYPDDKETKYTILPRLREARDTVLEALAHEPDQEALLTDPDNHYLGLVAAEKNKTSVAVEALVKIAEPVTGIPDEDEDADKAGYWYGVASRRLNWASRALQHLKILEGNPDA